MHLRRLGVRAMKLFWFAVLVGLLPAMADAAPLPPVDTAHLEGDWRFNGAPHDDACGRAGNFLYGIDIKMEFRLTGGQIFFDDGAEGAKPHRVLSAEKTGSDIVLMIDSEDAPLRVKLSGTGKFTITAAPAAFLDGVGKTFTQCLAGQPRDAIKLGKADMKFLATTMVPDAPRFVDARTKGGCKATRYQYLNFDLAAANFPQIRRETSDDLGAALAAHKKTATPMDSDGFGRWSIDGAEKTKAGYSVTVTELIAPNGARGDQMRLDIVVTRTGISIPAWKRSYLRCTAV